MKVDRAYLNAMVAVCKIVHWFKLLVDNADTGFVGADGNFFNVLRRLPLCFQLSVDLLSRLNGGLRVEFRWTAQRGAS